MAGARWFRTANGGLTEMGSRQPPDNTPKAAALHAGGGDPRCIAAQGRTSEPARQAKARADAVPPSAALTRVHRFSGAVAPGPADRRGRVAAFLAVGTGFRVVVFRGLAADGRVASTPLRLGPQLTAS